MILNLFLSLILALSLHFPINGQAQELNPEVQKALEPLMKKLGDAWEAGWSTDGTRITSLAITSQDEIDRRKELARLSYPIIPPETLEAIATTFLKNNSVIFQIPSDLADLQVKPAWKWNFGYHVRFQQTLHGVPIFDGGISINLDLGGDVTWVNTYSYVPNINIPTTPLFIV